MTPPEHILIGLTIGNIFYSIQTFLMKRHIPYYLLLIFAALFSIIPDIDSFFGSYTSTNIYSGHRGITHSIVFVLLASLIFSLLIYSAFKIFNFLFSTGHHSNLNIKILIIFSITLISGISHLLADLPQPPGVWGGIPLFYPYFSDNDFIRSGGWSKTGWYDYRILWTYIFSNAVSIMLVMIIYCFKKLQLNKFYKGIAVLLLLLNIGINIWLINHIRNSEYKSYHHWEKIQNEYLSRSNKYIYTLTVNSREYFIKIFQTIK